MKDVDCFLKAVEITGIVVGLFTYSQPLGIAVGAAILLYLYLMSNNDQNKEDENREDK
ncbi:hypothetical protein [Argonema galeatum]|uniref:hypothetical protein n=1 Tax=Argonema galeatum TaxID=2942762 RepID=UPI002010D0CB|nr:hypothetical protein [Argonema galeatum]MCL1468043.1 hypothetical protein [Argonema galeatum A003/A1]